MPKDNLKYTAIYTDGNMWYIRFCPLETTRFPHGLALTFQTDDREDIVMTAHSVEKYLDEWLKTLGVDNETRN